MFKKIIKNSIFTVLLVFYFTSLANAQIERTVEPFTGAKTYTSKYTFSDEQRNMHSISFIKTVKPISSTLNDTEIYFLLNFNLGQGVTLGDSFEIQVTDRHINALALTPNVVKGVGYTLSPTARTGMKDIPDMTKVAIEKGEELVVRVSFNPKGARIYRIPAEVVKEWAQILKDPEKDLIIEKKEESTENDSDKEAKFKISPF